MATPPILFNPLPGVAPDASGLSTQATPLQGFSGGGELLPAPSAPVLPQASLPAQPAPNYEQLSMQLTQPLGNHLRRMRRFRMPYDPKRAEYYKMYLGQRDGRMFPDGVTKRSNTSVPYALANVETIVSRVDDAFFANEEWFECKPGGMSDDMAAEAMQRVLAKKIHQSNFHSAFEEGVRNGGIYGHLALMVDWDFGYDIVTKPQMQFLIDPQTGQPAINPQTGQPIPMGVKPVTEKVPRKRPKFTAIDVYDLLVDPDGAFIARLVERSWGDMKREAETDPSLYIPEGLAAIAAKVNEEKEPDNIIIRMAEFWNAIDGTKTLMTFGEDAEALRWKDMRYAIRAGANYSTYRRKVLGGQPILLQHGENPFAHKRIPILHTSFIKVPGEVYGLGAIEIISDLSESLNRMVNMITDNWNLGINRRFAYDSNADVDQEALNNFNVPGGKVAVNGDPSKVIMPLPFFTPQANDYTLLDLYKNMIETSSGIADFYNRGVGSSGGNRTATGINSVINESNFRFRLFIRNLELDILQPLLEMCASMIQQYVTDQEEVLITDAPPSIAKWQIVQPADLLGMFNFNLVAANYASNKMLRQRNLLAFAQQVHESPWINEPEAIKELAKAFEIRNIGRLLKSPEQMQAEQQAQQQQQVQMMLLESALQTRQQMTIAANKPVGQGANGGRPRVHPGANVPGVSKVDNLIRSLAQNLGGNATGLGGAE